MMRMIIKRIVAVLLVTAMVMGGAGCSVKSKEEKLGVNEQALAHLEEKYGEKFAFYSVYGDSMSGTRSFLATCESFPDAKICVKVENYKTDNKVFRDNYLAYKYEAETRAFWKECAETQFEDVRIDYDVNDEGQSAELTGNATFEEYLADIGEWRRLMVELNGASYQSREQIEDIVHLIAEKGGHTYLTFVVIPEEMFSTMDSQTLDDLFFNNEYMDCADAWIDDTIRITWREVQ